MRRVHGRELDALQQLRGVAEDRRDTLHDLDLRRQFRLVCRTNGSRGTRLPEPAHSAAQIGGHRVEAGLELLRHPAGLARDDRPKGAD
jgi:hypothetical protein